VPRLIFLCAACLASLKCILSLLLISASRSILRLPNSWAQSKAIRPIMFQAMPKNMWKALTPLNACTLASSSFAVLVVLLSTAIPACTAWAVVLGAGFVLVLLRAESNALNSVRKAYSEYIHAIVTHIDIIDIW
jgi:hypothetical protein